MPADKPANIKGVLYPYKKKFHQKIVLFQALEQFLRIFMVNLGNGYKSYLV